MSEKSTKSVTAYLGHSGTPHDCARIDILPPLCGPYKIRKLAVQVDAQGISVSDLSPSDSGEPKIVLVVKYDDLPE